MHTRVLLCLVILVLIGRPALAGNGPYLDTVAHSPASPRQGQDVVVSLVPRDEANVSSMVLTHCRVEPSYACSIETDVFEEDAGGVWRATIRWDPHFFKGTTWVGYQILVELENGTRYTAPDENVPSPPPEGLPDDTAPYYFYRIEQPGAGSPWPGFALALVAIAVGGGIRLGRDRA